MENCRSAHFEEVFAKRNNNRKTISNNEELAEIFNKHFSEHVETLDVEKTLAKNIVSSDIKDPLMLKLCF